MKGCNCIRIYSFYNGNNNAKYAKEASLFYLYESGIQNFKTSVRMFVLRISFSVVTLHHFKIASLINLINDDLTSF